MPRIPVVSAEGRSAVTQLPGRVAAEDYGGAAQLGAAASNAGAVFTDIAVKLDRQKSDLLARMDQQEGELQGAQATQSLDTGLHRLSTEVLSDPTIPNPVEAFTERANALHRQIRDAATRPDVQRHVDRYAARALGVSTLKVEDEALKLQAGRHLGMLDETVRTLARQAGDTADPAEFDRKMQAARQHIDNATKRNYLTPKQASDLRQATEDEMLQANMVKVGRESRATLVRDELAGRWNALPQGKRLAALNEAREREDRVSAKIDKDFRELQRLTKDKLEALATAGTLSPSLLAEGQAGLNPVLTDASYWRHLEGINSGAWRPKQKNVAVEVLLDGFYSGAITVPRIDTYLERLNQLGRTLTGPDPELIAAKKSLAHHREQLENRATSQTAQKTEEAVRRAVDTVKTEKPGGLGGMLDKMLRAQSQVDQATVRNRVRDLVQKEGKSPSEASDIALKELNNAKRRKRETTMGQDEKALQDLLRR